MQKAENSELTLTGDGTNLHSTFSPVPGIWSGPVVGCPNCVGYKEKWILLLQIATAVALTADSCPVFSILVIL